MILSICIHSLMLYTLSLISFFLKGEAILIWRIKNIFLWRQIKIKFWWSITCFFSAGCGIFFWCFFSLSFTFFECFLMREMWIHHDTSNYCTIKELLGFYSLAMCRFPTTKIMHFSLKKQGFFLETNIHNSKFKDYSFIFLNFKCWTERKD